MFRPRVYYRRRIGYRSFRSNRYAHPRASRGPAVQYNHVGNIIQTGETFIKAGTMGLPDNRALRVRWVRVEFVLNTLPQTTGAPEISVAVLLDGNVLGRADSSILNKGVTTRRFIRLPASSTYADHYSGTDNILSLSVSNALGAFMLTYRIVMGVDQGYVNTM